MARLLKFSEPGTRWVEIPNDVGSGMRVLEAIVLELSLAGFERRQIGLIELAFTEALTNAVRHGNQDDPQKMVLIQYGIDDFGFELAIQDEGSGFDPGAVEDPTEHENLSRPGGRGLLLIRSLMVDVRFNDRGNQITMRLPRRVLAAA